MINSNINIKSVNTYYSIIIPGQYLKWGHSRPLQGVVKIILSYQNRKIT